jgi:hypothetical protein
MKLILKILTGFDARNMINILNKAKTDDFQF